MAITLADIIGTLEKGVQYAEELRPLITELTGNASVAASVVNVVSAVTEVVTNIVDRVADGMIVTNSTNQEQLQDLVKRLQDINDGLAQQIDES